MDCDDDRDRQQLTMLAAEDILNNPGNLAINRERQDLGQLFQQGSGVQLQESQQCKQENDKREKGQDQTEGQLVGIGHQMVFLDFPAKFTDACIGSVQIVQDMSGQSSPPGFQSAAA